MLYCDLILRSLPEVARRALLAMDLDNYEFKSDFARKYIRRGMKLGKAQGKAQGRMEIILKPLEGLLEGMPGITGTTLLGDGRVLLVLDLKEMLA